MTERRPDPGRDTTTAALHGWLLLATLSGEIHRSKPQTNIWERPAFKLASSTIPSVNMRIVIGLALGLLTLFSACSNSEEQSSATGTDSTRVEVQTFEGRGLVRSVMPNREYIVVDHEDIPGFMSAMEMPFALRDTALVAGVAAGDSIDFTVEVDGPYIHLTRIDILP